MELVEVKGVTKQVRKPVVLTVEQFYLILDLLPEPFRKMVLVAQCTGLRVEEVLALPWENIHFETLSMLVDRAVVHGRVQYVKTEYSEDELPLDPIFATELLKWKKGSNGAKLLFTSPVTGRHLHASPAQQDYLRPAGWCLVSCPTCGAEIGKRASKPIRGPKLPRKTSSGTKVAIALREKSDLSASQLEHYRQLTHPPVEDSRRAPALGNRTPP